MNFKTPFVSSAAPRVTLKGFREGVTGRTPDGLLAMTRDGSLCVTLEVVTRGAMLRISCAVGLGNRTGAATGGFLEVTLDGIVTL